MGIDTTIPPLCVPVSLDAFILNEAVCTAAAPAASNPGDPSPNQSLAAQSLVAPITQPNYQSLRLDRAQLQHDIVPNVDLHNSGRGLTNPRISTGLTAPFQDVRKDPNPSLNDQVKVDRKRLGIYLHWSLPRFFRSGSSHAAAPSTSSSGKSIRQSATTSSRPRPQPVFPAVPNRWLVVRILKAFTPADAKPDAVSAWIIESDRLRKVDELVLDENSQPLDLETDVSPFVAYSGDASNTNDILNSQAENFIGNKTSLAAWQEKKLRIDQKWANPPAPATDANFIDLTVMNSSNPLFADYTPHNANVFSIRDNLFYGSGQYLQSATCDYVVLGWHSDFAFDPLYRNTATDLATRLREQFLIPPEATNAGDADRLQSWEKTRFICHAAKFDVKYTSDTKPPTPAEQYANNFTNNIAMEPVAVGTSPLDAILAFFQAHSGTNDPELGTIFDADGKSTASTLMGIRELLYASEDNYDSRVKAADLIFSNNFARAAGGFRWRYDRKKDTGGPPAIPSDTRPALPLPGIPFSGLSEVELLDKINDAQRTIDAASSKLALLRWGLFAEWFKFLSDPIITSSSPGRTAIYSSRIPLLRKEADALTSLISEKQTDVNNMQNLIPVQKIADESYFLRNDPSLCLAGIDAGWDPQYLRNVPTRFADRLSQPTGSTTPDMTKILSFLGDAARFSSEKKVTPELTTLSATLVRLLAECTSGYQVKLPEEQDKPKDYAFKKWSAQPFVPQFVEWEGVYYHVPWSNDDSQTDWDIRLTNSALASSNHKQVQYMNPRLLSGRDNILTDRRSVAGRMLVLPQPAFALGAVVAQVLTTTPSNQLPNNLQTQEAKDDLIRKASKLKIISGELTGLSDGLLTLVNGQHVKPNLRKQGEETTALTPAVTAGAKIGMVAKDFDTIGGESGRTPYGTLVRFSDTAPNPFKGVKHGQLAIRRLAIVDKFGQSVSVPLPKRIPRPGVAGVGSQIPDFIHPCLSEQLIPSVLNGSLNTIYTPQQTKDSTTESGVPMTPFVQINPSINQEARLNATFLERRVDKATQQAFWHPCQDFDNPIFGWLIVNYADSALQFFTADGTFYTSRQFGGPTGTMESLKWLPFDPPPANIAAGKVSPQLINLIAKMEDPQNENNAGRTYLQTIWDIVRVAIPSMPFPPSDYSGYANAIVGKPLALINAGWSIELSQPPYWSQHTIPEPPAPGTGKVDPLRTLAKTRMNEYQFKIKIGDAERPFDGVVAYWDVGSTSTTKTETDFSRIFAYSQPDVGKAITSVIEPSNFPKLTPYYLDPDTRFQGQNLTFSDLHTSVLLVKTLLVDPYTPIHVYSGILPIRSLTIPKWSIQQALKTMTAFFTMGPLLLTKDVPSTYDPTHPLGPDSWLDSQAQSTDDSKPEPIKLPIAGGKGTWNWLQPYLVQAPAANKQAGVNASGDSAETKYNALAVGNEDGRMRQDPAPYTFVEGYLQLAKPLKPVDPATGAVK